MRPKRRVRGENATNQPVPARILNDVDENEEDNNESDEEYVPMEENSADNTEPDNIEPQPIQVPQAWVIAGPTLHAKSGENTKTQKDADVDKKLLSIARERWVKDSLWVYKGDRMPIAKTKSVLQIPGQKEDNVKEKSTMNVEETIKKIHNYSMRGKLPEEFHASVVIGHPLKIHKNLERSIHHPDSVSFMDVYCQYSPERPWNHRREDVMWNPKSMLLTVNIFSKSAVEVHWALNDTRIMDSNEVLKTNLEVGELPNHYRSTIRINTDNVNCAGDYYILIINQSKFRWTRFHIDFEKFRGPNQDGNAFTVMGNLLSQTICGVKLQNVLPNEYDVQWKLNGEKLDAEKYGVSLTTKHNDWQSGNYALMEIPQLALLPKGEYTCTITNERGSREIRCDPFAETHFETILTSSPDFTGRLYQHSATQIMKIEFEIIVKYRACYPIHATAWTKHGNLFQHNARFSNFMEQRVRIGPDSYASILTFECLKRPNNPPIDRLWFRFCVMCVGGNQEGFVEVRFDWSLSEMVEQHYANMPTTGWDAIQLVEKPLASLL